MSLNITAEKTVEGADFKEVYHRLLTLHQTIRRYSPMNLNFLKLSSELTYREWMNGRSVQRKVFFLPTIHGCSWKHDTGGCLICGMSQGGGVRLPSAPATKAIIDRITSLHVNQEAPEWICLYNEGSFLNPVELPHSAQRFIIEMIAEIPSVRRITIESRPQFITAEALKILTSVSTFGVEIEIGIGVEVSNDFVRHYCINKGFSWAEFETAVGIISKYKGLRALAYVLLKPPFLSESEAIDEAVKTIYKCFQVGTSAVSLEIMSIHEWSLVEYLWLKRFYELPMVWSAIDTVLKTEKFGEVRIGGEPETYFPKSLFAAHHCERCTERVWTAIRHYNESHNINYLTELFCECREKWVKMIKEERRNEEEIENSIRHRISNLKNIPLSFADYLKEKILGVKKYGEYQFCNI